MIEKILNIFEGYRMDPTSIDQYESAGKQLLAGQIEKFIAKNEPIKFTMLGLPFKSTNKRDKVLGELPDLGEELTIKNFETFNENVKAIYSPGIRINVASDGFMFNDILDVADKTVIEYKGITESYRTNSTVSIIEINDFYSTKNTGQNREKIMQQFGYTWEKLEQQILFNPDTQMLYKSMIRFMEEEIADKDFVSGNQRHKAAKMLSREMMLRNEAYNLLVRNELSDHIRLSMHPSVNNGYKYSFKLIPGRHTHHSPWHSAIVMSGQEAITMHRIDAERAGYELVFKDNRPYNFVTI